jgi:flagellar motility protein MotE (MotC chaperone)
MTMPIKFDTLRYTNSLIEAGIPPEQAEAQAIALTQAMDEATVTPSELVLLRSDLIARIEMLRIEINEKFDALRAEMNDKLEELEERFNANLEALEERFNAKLEALEERFDAKLELLEQRLRAYIDRKLVTVYWMVGISLALHAVTIGILVKILDRLP